MVCAVAVAAVSFWGRCCLRRRSGGAKHRLGDDGSSRIAGFATTLLGRQTAKQIQQTTVDLKSQFDAKRQMPKPQFIQKMNLVD